MRKREKSEQIIRVGKVGGDENRVKEKDKKRTKKKNQRFKKN